MIPMSRPKILHIAPMNVSGVPGQFVRAERRLGFESRLVTLYRDTRGYPEDICLDLPHITSGLAGGLKKRVSDPAKLHVSNRRAAPGSIPIRWAPYSPAERLLVLLRDLAWIPRIERSIRRYGLDEFQVYQLDGGLGLYRHVWFLSRLRNVQVICCYMGSDLRTRGVLQKIDNLSRLNVTVEWDHRQLHPNIHHVFFPFDAATLVPRPLRGDHPLRIGHAPTSREAKGSDIILAGLQEIAEHWPIEIELIENLPWERAMERKRECDIFVDQIGDLGYGINALEALALGIPTCSCLAPGFADAHPDHPFVDVDAGNLKSKIIGLIENPRLRQELGERGRAWVLKMHDPISSVRRIHRLAGVD